MLANIENVMKRHGTELLGAVRIREPVAARGENIESLMIRFAAADPSYTKGFTNWLVEAYLRDGLRLGQLSRAQQLLTTFRANRFKMKVEKRDLARYKTLEDLSLAMREFLPSPPGEDAARQASRILLERDDGLTIVVPRTGFAMQWWGRKCHWDEFLPDGRGYGVFRDLPPIVVVLPNGSSMLLLLKGGTPEFMNENGRRIAADVIEAMWEHLEPLIRWLVTRHGMALRFVPEEVRSPTMCAQAVTLDGLALQFVPEDLLLRRGLCETAARQNGLALEFVPQELVDAGMASIAVMQNGLALEFVPDTMRDRTLCLAAVRQTGLALAHVPVRFFEPGFLKAAVESDGMALGVLPEQLRDHDLCISAVARYGLALAHVPAMFIDYRMCEMAVRQNGWALEFVPTTLLDLPLMQLAVDQDQGALAIVPLEDRAHIRIPTADVPERDDQDHLDPIMLEEIAEHLTYVEKVNPGHR